MVPLAVFSSPVSTPLPRTRERVRLRDLVTIISKESILTRDVGLRPRVFGDEGGNVALPVDNDAALHGLASEHRYGREAGVAVVCYIELSDCTFKVHPIQMLRRMRVG